MLAEEGKFTDFRLSRAAGAALPLPERRWERGARVELLQAGINNLPQCHTQ